MWVGEITARNIVLNAAEAEKARLIRILTANQNDEKSSYSPLGDRDTLIPATVFRRRRISS